MKKYSNYNFSIDVIRTLAIFGVVAIHTVNSVFERPDFFGGKSWWITIVIDSISRISIPLFIMISGYLLLVKNEKFDLTLKRILNRLAIPLVFWTLVTYISAHLNDFSAIFKPVFYLRFITGDVYLYYFLTILIGLYFISPLLSSFLSKSKVKEQIIFSFSFLVVGMMSMGGQYLIKSCASENLFTKGLPYIGLFMIGYLVGTNKLIVKNKFVTMILYMLGVVATVCLNYYYYSQGSISVLRSNYPGCITHYADTYLSVNVVLMSITAFLLLFNAKFQSLKNTVLEKVVYSIARASFGIYLVHLFVVNFWDNYLLWNVDNTTLPLWIYALLKWICVFVISYLISVIIRKIPRLRKVFGEDN